MRPAVCRQISGPVVCSWAQGSSGCRTGWAGRPRGLPHQALGHRVVRRRVVGLDRHRAHDHVGAVGLQQPDLLGRHLVGDHEDAAVAPLGRHDGQAHAGVAGGGLDDGAAGPEQALVLGPGDHGQGGAVLDAAAGVEHLQLGRHRAGQPLGHPVQPQEGRVADQVDQRTRDLGLGVGHGGPMVPTLTRRARSAPPVDGCHALVAGRTATPVAPAASGRPGRARAAGPGPWPRARSPRRAAACTVSSG